MTSRHLVLPQLPSRAFGDGSHPTTRVCVRAVDLVCRQRSPTAVLDVGSGTGILARTARARGSTFVVATDVDPESLRAIPENAALDDTSIPIHVHDARAFPPDAWGSRFHLVVANILEGVLVALAPSLARAVAPGGVLLLAGFTRAQAPALRLTFTSLGLHVDVQAHAEEWVLLQLARPT